MNNIDGLRARRDELNARRRHDCTQQLSLRARIIRGQSKPAYFNQCSVCGEARGNALSLSAAAAALAGKTAVPFDDALAERWVAEGEELRRITRELLLVDDESNPARALLHQLSDIALELPTKMEPEQASAWFARTAAGVHEESRRRRAESTHRFQSETELNSWLEAHFGDDFEIEAQVRGEHLTELQRVVIDFVLYPRPHLVDAGCIETPLGVEVKFLDQDGGFTRKATRAVWQAVSYMDSAFELRAGRGRLKAVLLFTNLSFGAETSLLRVKNDGSDRSEWRAALGVANHAGVGELAVAGDRDAPSGWSIRFGGSAAYFGRMDRQGQRRYFVGNERLLGKVRIGNF